MRYLLIILVMLISLSKAEGQFRPFEMELRKKEKSPPAKQPATIKHVNKYPIGNPYDEVTTHFECKDFVNWSVCVVDKQSCRVSGLLRFGPLYEVNHHRMTVTFRGSGSVQLSLGHSGAANLEAVIVNRYLRSPFKVMPNGKEVSFVSHSKDQRCVWLFVRTEGDVVITDIKHTCWRGKDTLYGHVPGVFEFEGGQLPYRLMYPRNYDPDRAYPLVLSVSGSGGIGTDNVRNMENVILGRYLFIQYYFDPELECFSLVPQISPSKDIPAPYWPGGKLGEPTPFYHPDFPAVNEKGWYTQASLALIRNLIEDKAFHIDPNRVYYTGFSYGGKGCWEFLKADGELFAAAMCGGGWPIGRCYANLTDILLEQLKLEVDRYKHIPVFIFAGALDQMRLSSKAVHEEILAQGGQSTYVEFAETNHVSSAGRGWGQRANIAWLLEQKRRDKAKSAEVPEH